MQTTLEMIKTHPREPLLDSGLLAKAIGELYTCAQVCTGCADACIGEPEVKTLAGCIQRNLDCADICGATGAVLSRMTDPSTELLRSLLRTCARSCNLCAAECEKHAQMHAHCGICAEACRRCEKSCLDIAESIR